MRLRFAIHSAGAAAILILAGGCAMEPAETAPIAITQAQRDLHRIDHALIAYHAATGRWPDNGEGLRALVRRPDAGRGQSFPHALATIPSDPWGRRYQYRFNPALDRISLWSFGEDVVNGADDLRIDRPAGLSR